MIKYRLVSPYVGEHVQLHDTETSCKMSLTYADNLPFPPDGKKVKEAWKYFEDAGWKIQRVRVIIEVL